MIKAVEVHILSFYEEEEYFIKPIMVPIAEQ